MGGWGGGVQGPQWAASSRQPPQEPGLAHACACPPSRAPEWTAWLREQQAGLSLSGSGQVGRGVWPRLLPGTVLLPN